MLSCSLFTSGRLFTWLKSPCGSKLWSQLCMVFNHSPPWMSLVSSYPSVPTSWSRQLWCMSSERWSLCARAVSWHAAGLDTQRDFSRVAPSEGKCWQSRQQPDGDIRATAQGCSGRQMDTSPSLAQPPGPGPPPTHKGPALLLVLGNTCYEIMGHGRMWYAFHRAGISVRSSSSKLFSCHHQDHHLLYF